MEFTLDNTDPLGAFKRRSHKAKENFYYLNKHSNFLDDSEKKVLKVIAAKGQWNIQTDILWLDLKRRQIDAEYDELRRLETKLATIESQVKSIEQQDAINRMNKQIEEIRIEQTTGLPATSEKEMEMIWRYLRTNPRMKRRLYGE